ncbi:MAG: TonB-dependent receptor [Deltaproteobacteria bacterium]|nr:TonB-dependent receptor [Deltaproteobacteria bacterium]
MVTATKRAERLQDVTQSITAFSADDLNFMGAQNISGMIESVPGVELRNYQAGVGSITMRGVAEMSTVQGGPGAAVGYYMDELPLTMAGYFPDVATFDMARVEVLRGPQGTLFGEGSMSGTIRMISNKPDSTEFDDYVELTYSHTENGTNNYTANGMLNLPLIKDKMAIRLVALYGDEGGYIDRTDPATGAVIEEDINGDETIGVRMALRFAPSERLTLDSTVLYSKSERERYSFATSSMTFSTLAPESFNDDLLGLNLTIQYEFSFADLISSTSYFDRDVEGTEDQSDLNSTIEGFNFMMGGFTPIFPGLSVFGLPGPTWFTPDGVYIDQTVESEAISQELRLVSKGDGPCRWVLGAFYKEQKARFYMDAHTIPVTDSAYAAAIGQIPFPPFAGAAAFALRVDAGATYEQFAGFGELSYDFLEKFTVTAGGRYFKEYQDATTTEHGFFLSALLSPTGTFTNSADSSVFNPTLQLRYKFTDDLMSYAQYSKGFRSGGQNLYLLPGAPVFYDPETLTNYELGLKSTFWNGRARLNVAGYYMDWSDLQVVTVQGPGGAGDSIDNTGDAHTMGVDVEFFLRPIKGLQWSVGGTFLEAETDDDYMVEGNLIPAGTPIPMAAEIMFNTALQYNCLLTENLWGFARASYSYTGEAPAESLLSDFDTPAYEIVNFRAGIEQENWQLTVFVDNMFDEHIIYDYGAEVDLYDGAPQSTVGRPRTIGVSLRFAF